MKVMQFRENGVGEDDQLADPIIYEGWRDLARNCPWAEIDFDTLEEEQLATLIKELREAAPEMEARDGVEQATVIIPEERLENPIQRFAARNLRRYLARQAENEDWVTPPTERAIARIEQVLGAYHGLRKTYIKRADDTQPTSRQAKHHPHAGDWVLNREPPPIQDFFESGGNLFNGARGDTLLGAYLAGFLAPFTELWHAVRILYHLEVAKQHIAKDDAARAAQCARVVGNSEAALGVKEFETYALTEMAQVEARQQGGYDSGKKRRAQSEDRNRWLRERAAKMGAKAVGGMSISAKATKLERELQDMAAKTRWKAIGQNRIRTLIRE